MTGTRNRPPGSILITGASSGLGGALAERYAAPGIRLALAGRNAERLDAIAARCRDRGATVQAESLDVTDARATGAWVLAADDAAPLDLVVAAAGISGGPQEGEITEGLASATGQVAANLLGVMHVMEPVLPRLLARKRGHVAMVSSVAGYRGLPYSPAYSASKAGVRAYGDGLRAAIRPHGVACSVIVPGFFDSPMTDRFMGDKPFLMSLDRAAGIVRAGLDRRRARIVFPRLLGLGIQATDLMPWFLGDLILRSVRFHIRPR
jgi:NADP-dependent 3-hydroxy acid dehydrogenase YdfG